MTETQIEIPRPTSGDVLERILQDHRLFEDLLRQARRTDTDRAAARSVLAEVLVAHARSEEEKVYPTLRRTRAITEHEEEHGEEEHAEILEALLGFLRAKGTDTQKYDDALEELATVVNHHSNEEEQTIINPAREDVSLERREDLGVAWLTRRNQLLEQGCASEKQVAALLHEAVDEGVLAPEAAREEADAVKAAAKEKAKEIEESAKQDYGARPDGVGTVVPVTPRPRRAVCPGSYDPVTSGHLDVIARAAALHDEVVVAVLHNPAKAGTFTVDERIGFVERAVSAMGLGERVRVQAFAERLLVDVCRELEADVVVKGVRGPSDVTYEWPMALMNRHLTGVETLFLPGDPAFEHVSSSLVKEVARWGGDVTGLVPDEVRDALVARLRADR